MVRDNKILLIRRVKGSYTGLLGMPGGKIEQNEHAATAAVRETREESGIESEVKRFMGIVSEHEKEGGKIINHYLLFLFELFPKTDAIKEGTEGELEWVDLNGIGKLKDRVIPSDFAIIEKMMANENPRYYECTIEKSGDSYLLREFKRVG